MGLYARKDSKYWWMRHRSGPGVSTGIPREGPTPAITRANRQRAEEVFNAEVTHAVRVQAGLEDDTGEAIRVEEYATWWAEHKLPLLKSNPRNTDLLTRVRIAFGEYLLTDIDRTLVTEYITQRLRDRVGPVPKCCGQSLEVHDTLLQCARCRRTRADARRTLQPGTINREVDFLKGLLRDAVPRYLKASPLAGMRKLREVPAEKRVCTAEEVARIAQELTPSSRRVLFLLAAETLIRFGNAINLQRSENKGTHLALLDSKTGPYTVPLNARLRQMLASLPHHGPYYFAELREAKNPRDWRGAMRLAVRRACQRAGVPYGRLRGGTTFHAATRATGATLQLQQGNDLRTVQENGNWKDLRAMQRYLQTDLAHRRAASEGVGSAIAEAMAKDADKRRITNDGEPR
jgi:hypothetical protein